MAKAVWGVDVSRYSAKAARLVRDGDRIVLTAAEVHPYGFSGRPSEEQVETAIRETLRGLRRRIGGEPVVMSLPTHAGWNRLISLPPVTDLDKAIRYEAQDKIPFSLDQVVWGYQLVERAYGPEEGKEVILFALKRDIVENFVRIIEPVGLNLIQLQLSPVALYNFLSYDQDLSRPLVVLEMGADNSSLIVLEEGRLWIRNLPIVGNDLTRIVSESLRVPFEQAESLKTHAAESPQVEKIHEAMMPLYKQVVSEIHRSLGFYKSQFKKARFDRLLLAGNATRGLNFERFLGQALQLATLRIEKLNRIELAAGFPVPILRENIGSLGTALGLALQGVGAARNQVNLLPLDFLERRAARRKYPVVAAGIAMLYVALGIAWFAVERSLSEIHDVRRRVQDLEAKIRAQREEWSRARETKDLEDRLRALTAAVPDRKAIRDAVDQLLSRFPKKNSDPDTPDHQKVWLYSLRAELLDPSAPQPQAAPGRVLRVEAKIAITHRETDRVYENPAGEVRTPEKGYEFVKRSLQWDQFDFRGTKSLAGSGFLTDLPVYNLEEELRPDQDRKPIEAKDAVFQSYTITLTKNLGEEASP